MYEALFELQGGRCRICGRPPKDKNLNLDHKHLKIQAFRTGFSEPGAKWEAWATLPDGHKLTRYGTTRAIAVNTARFAALPLSVRGLLCPGRHRGCNRLLGRVDDINWLKAAIAYLEEIPAKEILDKFKKA